MGLDGLALSKASAKVTSLSYQYTYAPFRRSAVLRYIMSGSRLRLLISRPNHVLQLRKLCGNKRFSAVSVSSRRAAGRKSVLSSVRELMLFLEGDPAHLEAELFMRSRT